MRHRIVALLIVAGVISGLPRAQADTLIALVPKPLRMEPATGKFVLNRDTVILIDKNCADAANVAKQLAERIRRATGFELAVTPNDGQAAVQNAIRLTAKNALATLGPEGYTLDATPEVVTIAAGDGAGLFYGTQTLLQLLPPQVFATKKVEGDVEWAVPAVKIEDQPRFRWRSLLIDPARHFLSKQEVESFIDLMAQHKLNTLQIHFTDEEGWRIEIKRYPKLTSVSAWRTSDPWFGTKYPADKPYGGFFTQDDIREIVAYAKARYINVVPEIEMPAHTGGAIAAYPQISCTGKRAAEVCPSTEATYEILQGVLAEVCEMFPSKYIHIGGDEATKRDWKRCPKCKERMKQEGLKDLNELQSYFIRRMEKFLNARGRTLVGWDEILEGGVAPNAVVMSWRGIQGGITAANADHDVVMTPIENCYFDYGQAKTGEPRAFGGMPVPLRTVYAFEPVPKALAPDKAKHILGGGGNLWGEVIPNYRHLQYMAYPRACAMAEVTWTDPKLKNWSDFWNRLDVHLQRLKAQGVNYRQPRPDDNAKANSVD
jgi:hexosaminidase